MTPLPVGFRLRPDRRIRRLDRGRLLVGGSPRRVVRLTDRGAGIATRLLAGAEVQTPAEAALARRLVDAGLAHPMPAATRSDVVVVVPAYDDAAALGRCLTALGAGLSVTVVDDGSADGAGMRAVAERHGAALRRLDTNAGPGAARNAGARGATADLIAFVDSDAVTTADALRRLAAHFADPTVAAVAPRVRPAPGCSADRLAAFADAMSPLDLGPDPSPVSPERLVTYVPSTVLLVRRSAFEAVGGFDPSLRFGEDVDLVWRLNAAGHTVRYAPDVLVHHSEPTSWQSWLTRRFRYGTSTGALARRHGPSALTLRLHPAPALTVALAATGHRRAAVVSALATAGRVAVRMRRLQLPPAATVGPTLVAPGATALAAARWATPLWWPALVAGLASRRLRPAALAALTAPPLLTWASRRPEMGPLTWTAACWADAAAYGAGVWRGCARHRTALPLLPTIRADAPSSPRRHRDET